MKKDLDRRLSYLYTGECSAVIVFLVISFLVNQAYPELRLYSLTSFWVSFFLLEFLLLQGTVYWYSKRKVLRKENRSITPDRIVRLLRTLKKWNVGLIIVIPGMFILDLVKMDPVPSGGLYVAGFIYLFSILEYINYFHIQLSYDNNSDIKNLIRSKKLKKACLRRDFERIHQK